MEQQPLFSILFKDGTNYSGGINYFDTKWMGIPNKPIKSIFYKLPHGEYLCLSGADQYFHMVEATQDWMRICKNNATALNDKPKIEYAYIMAKYGQKVISYRITLVSKKNDKYKLGDITFREFDIEDKNVTKLNANNWKPYNIGKK